MRHVLLFIGAVALATPLSRGALAAEPAPPALAGDDASEPSGWDFRVQSTYIFQAHPAFPARYSGPNSFDARSEPRSFTWSATGYIAARPWRGGELHFDPEMMAAQSLSELHGLGGLSNGEDQKGGSAIPSFYRARLFLRQTWGLGGGSDTLDAAPDQMAAVVDHDRLVVTAGVVSVIDIFDGNRYSHDPRTQFLNWTLMTHGAFDYAADTRGYTLGAAAEYRAGDWALRLGRFAEPRRSNGFTLDDRILQHYGDVAELEHQHQWASRPGALRLLAFRNRAPMGGFGDALNLWRANGSVGVPDLGAVRKERTKTGAGVNLEQAVTDDLGLFARASWNDGQSETWSFTEVEQSVSGGLSITGADWGRPQDGIGLGYAQNGISAVHRDYLAHGGLGAFIGDGVPPPGASFHYAPEAITEAWYSASVARGCAVSIDYQYIANPAYNADRGPVSVYGFRVHLEH